MFVPDTKFGRGSQYAMVPDMMGIEYMTKKSNAVVRNLVQTTALLNCFFITKKIVIEELLQKCLHLTLSINLVSTPILFPKAPWLPKFLLLRSVRNLHTRHLQNLRIPNPILCP